MLPAGSRALPSHYIIRKMNSIKFILLILVAASSIRPGSSTPSPKKPNFVVILLDDLDVFMNSTHRAWMPSLWSNVADQGAVFRNMAVSMAWCCPSRVSLLTGKLVHNSNITSSSPPNGGASKFMTSGMDAESLGVWMQELGYNTYFTGKFLNQMSSRLIDRTRCPMGWDSFEVCTNQNQSISFSSCINLIVPTRRCLMVTMGFSTSGFSNPSSLKIARGRSILAPTELITRLTSSGIRLCTTSMMR